MFIAALWAMLHGRLVCRLAADDAFKLNPASDRNAQDTQPMPRETSKDQTRPPPLLQR